MRARFCFCVIVVAWLCCDREALHKADVFHEDLDHINHAMESATTFIKKLQKDGTSANKVANAKISVLNLSLVRKSKEVEQSRNEMSLVVADNTLLRSQVNDLTAENQSLQSRLEDKEEQLERALRLGASSGAGYVTPTLCLLLLCGACWCYY